MKRPMLTLLVSIFVSSIASADDPIARVRSAVDSKAPMWVGQGVIFHVDLLSATIFSGSPKFELPEIENVLILKDSGRPVVSSEQLDDQTWSVQRHQFRAYPQRPGSITIPSFTVRFGVPPAFGQPPEAQQLQTDAMSFEAQMPPGTQGFRQIISTSELNVDDSWQPTPNEEQTIACEVGDAITRVITLRAADVPGMALPPVALPSPEGLAAYPKPSQVEDQTDRGSLTGVRSDGMTLICERPGRIELPGLIIPWWNTADEKLEQVTLPAVAVQVAAAAPQSSDEAAAEPTATELLTPRSWILLTLATLLIGLTIWRRQSLQQRWRQWSAERAASEPGKFAQLSRSCRSASPQQILGDLYAWLATAYTPHPASLKDFVADVGSTKLGQQLDGLQQHVVGRQATWNRSILLAELKSARSRRGDRPPASDRGLPRLNPESTTAAEGSHECLHEGQPHTVRRS